MSAETGRPHGRWQFAVFGASLVLALLVWVVFPEPEESRRGYTASGCYGSGRELFLAASASADLYRRSERYAAAVKYLDALEKRFGVVQSRWDAYEMLGDARMELAAAASDAELARQLRLAPPEQSRREALRAYREALARLSPPDESRPRLLRKEAEALFSLGRPSETLAVLRELVKRYRQGDIDRLDRERSSGLPSAGALRGEGSDEARAVYYLAGNAALAAKREAEARSHAAQASGLADAASAERALAAGYREEAQRAFRLFLEAGGSGDRRASAEKALGDIAFERADAERGEVAMALLDEARAHYAAAGTAETSFLLARVLFRRGDPEAALRRLRSGKWASPGELRARRYMEARCLLALGRENEASAVFRELRADNPDDAEAASALVGLAELARRAGDLAGSKKLLLDAVVSRTRSGSGVPFPERDAELEPGRLAARLLDLGREIELAGPVEDAVELYRSAAALAPEGPVPALRRIARAWEAKASREGSRDSSLRAGEAHIELADALPRGPTRREALRRAAELFDEGSSRARAVLAATRFLRENPDDELASRMLFFLGCWERELGLLDRSSARHRENIERHPSDVYADRSRLELARNLSDGTSDAELAEARSLLAELVRGARYGKDCLVRLEALFELGSLDVRLAERRLRDGAPPGSPELRELLEEGLKVLDEALGFAPGGATEELKRSRPLFAEVVARERPRALLARGVALEALGRLYESREALGAAFREGAGPTAALYEGLAACAEPGRGPEPALLSNSHLFDGSADAAWAYTCAALARLARSDREQAAVLAARGADAAKAAGGARTANELLPPEYWGSWAEWLASRARMENADARQD